MPHIVLEYSSNVATAVNAAVLLEELHAALGRVETFEADRVKSRAIEVATHHVGSGVPRGFVHAGVAFSPGRSDAVREDLGRRLLGILVRGTGSAGIAVARSVEIRQFEPGMYFTDRGGDGDSPAA